MPKYFDAVRTAFFAGIALTLAQSFLGLQVPVVGPYLTWLVLGLFLAMNLMGGMAASGAFEVVDQDTGRVLFSKLQTGRMPEMQEVLAKLQDQK